jgi:ornithine cyclodeaminase/alanine dehydrogenase-like protein (mu-crystallin family)
MAVSQTPFISAEQINALCSYEKIIENQRKVFSNFADQIAVMGPRAILTQGENAQFSYIARASESGPTIVKFGTVIPSNFTRNIPVVQTKIAVIDPLTGTVKLFLDGESVTKWRTVAASMAAAKELSNPVKTVGVIGLGHQGFAHIKAVKEIFSPKKIIGFARGDKNLDLDIEISKDLGLVNQCDLIFVCTNSISPVITSVLNPGTTCISIGSFAPNRLEVSVEALANADKVFGDDAKTISEQAGSVVSTLAIPKRKWDKPESIGELYNQRIKGRTTVDQVIYYFSVGLGIQDAAMAEFILQNGKF